MSNKKESKLESSVEQELFKEITALRAEIKELRAEQKDTRAFNGQEFSSISKSLDIIIAKGSTGKRAVTNDKKKKNAKEEEEKKEFPFRTSKSWFQDAWAKDKDVVIKEFFSGKEDDVKKILKGIDSDLSPEKRTEKEVGLVWKEFILGGGEGKDDPRNKIKVRFDQEKNLWNKANLTPVSTEKEPSDDE